MCATPVFPSAAMGRPFIFLSQPSPVLIAAGGAKKPVGAVSATALAPAAAKMKSAEILAQVGAVSKLAAVVPASRLEVRAAPEMVSSGIPQLDALTGGLPRGCLTEICGTASSGRTGILLSALTHATQRGEVCALVDASDVFDPSSAAATGMELSRLLWVRCGEKFSSHPSQRFREGRGWELQLTQMLKVTDLLLQSNGFGMIALDLGDIPARSARKIPLASWFRFRRVVEHTSTVLLVLEQHPIAGSCSSVLVKVSGVRPQLSDNRSACSELPHSKLLDQLEITAELLRSRLERKPVQSAVSFSSRAVWAG